MKKVMSIVLVCMLCIAAFPMNTFADCKVGKTEVGFVFAGDKVSKTVKMPSKGKIKVNLQGKWEDDASLTGKAGMMVETSGKYTLSVVNAKGAKVDSKTFTMNSKDVSFTTDVLPKGTYKVHLGRNKNQPYGYYKMTVSYVGHNVKAKDMKLNKSSVTMTKDNTYTLAATLTPKHASTKVSWSSSNKNVATVTSTGKVKAKAMGNATITVKCGDLKKTCTIKVRKDDQEYWIGATKNLTNFIKQDKNYKKAKWTTSNKDIVSVTSAGKIKTQKHGKAVITAKVEKKAYKFTVYSYSKDVLKNKAVKHVSQTGTPHEEEITYPKVGRISVPWTYMESKEYVFDGGYKNGVFGQYIDGGFVKLQ